MGEIPFLYCNFRNFEKKKWKNFTKLLKAQYWSKLENVFYYWKFRKIWQNFGTNCQTIKTTNLERIGFYFFNSSSLKQNFTKFSKPQNWKELGSFLFIYWFSKKKKIENFHQLPSDKIGQNWKLFLEMKIQENLTRNWKILKTTNFEWIESFFSFTKKFKNFAKLLKYKNYLFYHLD